MTWLVVTIFLVVLVTLIVAGYYMYQARPSALRASASTAEKQRQVPAPVAMGSNNAARWGAGLIVIGAVGAFLLFQPDTSDSDITYAEQRQAIADADDVNNDRTEGAPQQAVVNGWTTIDHLELLSIQQEESDARREQSDKRREQSDNRRDALLLLLVVGVALAVAKRE